MPGERLGPLGGLDAGQAHLHLLLTLNPDRKGVAVCDADDTAFEEVGGRPWSDEEREGELKPWNRSKFMRLRQSPFCASG